MSWFVNHFTPMWIVWFIALAVGTIVAGMLLHLHKRGESFRDTAGTNVFTILGLTLFVTSFLAFLDFSSPTVADWWQALAVRVAWHVGGMVVLEIGIVLDASYGGSLGEKPVWILMGAFFAVAAWISWNPALDLIRGPVVLHGKAAIQIEKARVGRGGGGIWASVALKTADGANVTIDMRGWGAERAESLFESCDPNDDVAVTVLLHTGRVLDVECKKR